MKSSVCHDLSISPYITKQDNYIFVFSSHFNKNRFDKKLDEYYHEEISKLECKYCCRVYAKSVIMVTLYKQIEKRGFRIYKNNTLLEKDYSISLGID